VSEGKIELMPEYTTLTEAATAALQIGLGPIEEAGLPMGPTVVISHGKIKITKSSCASWKTIKSNSWRPAQRSARSDARAFVEDLSECSDRSNAAAMAIGHQLATIWEKRAN
jgi:hypothetical protein